MRDAEVNDCCAVNVVLLCDTVIIYINNVFDVNHLNEVALNMGEILLSNACVWPAINKEC